MMMGRLLGLGCLAWAVACAQTFPPEFRTDDETAGSRIRHLLERMGDRHASLSGEFQRLIRLPANRVYRQMDEQARVAALRTALPLVKQLAMSDAIRKRHDETIAQVSGAVNHGLKLPPAGSDPQQRMNEMSAQMSKNPAVMSNPKFMEEFMSVQDQAAAQGAAAAYDSSLTIFTRPLADVKRQSEQGKEGAGSNSRLAKCYADALPLAASDEQRFRLQVFRCEMMNYGKEKTEAEADSFRKERAQRLYDEKGVEGTVRKILREFLAKASSVDFTAQTTEKGSRQVFVNPEFEKKDGLWKLIYRNGKEPTEVAVQFARAWLAELTPAPVAARPAPGAKAAPKK